MMRSLVLTLRCRLFSSREPHWATCWNFDASSDSPVKSVESVAAALAAGCGCECANTTSQEACSGQKEVRYSARDRASHCHATAGARRVGRRVHWRVVPCRFRPSASACFRLRARVSASLLRSSPTCLCGICSTAMSA